MTGFNLHDLKQDLVFESALKGQKMTFHTTWGLFSPREIDAGSQLLIENISVQSTDDILDLGCGYGPIGLTLAKLASHGKTHLIDKDFVAIEYAQKNAELNQLKNTEIYLSNGFSRVPDSKFDLIVSNVPAKVGKELFWIFLTEAKLHLKPGGKIYIVAISGWKEFIKRNFVEVFGNCEKIVTDKTYSVWSATV